MLLTLLALLSVVVALMASGAQTTFRGDPDYLIDTWEAEEGWLGSPVHAMAQTPDGYLWLGTRQGLVRFDGVRFTVFGKSSVPELPQSPILVLHLDRSGRLWAGTARGLAVRTGTEWREVALPGTNNMRGSHVIRGLAERSDGDMLVTTQDGGVLEFRSGQLHALPPPPGESHQPYAGCVDAAGNWWVVQHKFVGKWDGQRWIETASLAATSNPGLDQVRCAAGRAGGVWLVLGSELRHYRGGTETARTPLPGVKGKVTSLLEDSRGNVWIGTQGTGLWQVSSNRHVRQWSPSNGLPDNTLRCVFEDGERNVWAGTESGSLTRFKERIFQSFLTVTNRLTVTRFALAALPTGGVYIASRTQGVWLAEAEGVAKVPLPKPCDDARVSGLSLLMDRTGVLWAGAMMNGVWRVEGQKAQWLPIDDSGGSPARTLREDSRGRVWITGGQSLSFFAAGEMHGFGLAEGLPAGSVGAVAEDRAGTIWLAHARGFFRLDTNRLTHVVAAEGGGLQANSLYADSNGVLWVAPITGGLACWDQSRLFRKTLPPELPMREVRGFLEDHLGFLWMTSHQGVLRAPKNELKAWLEGRQSAVAWRAFDLSDGLPGVDCADSARDGQGRLWFATERGVARVDPAVDRPPSTPPPVRIEEVTYHRASARVYGGEAAGAPAPPVRSRLQGPFPARLTLPAGSRRMEVHYTALDLTAPEKLRFQTRLEPGDSDWSDVGNRRVAYYYDFHPGSYVFRVRAMNHAGLWNEAGPGLAFTVEPHLWQTLWVKALGLAALAAAIYGVLHRRVIQLEKARAAQHTFTRQILQSQENERKRVAGELHDGLGQDLSLIKNRLALAAARQGDAAELSCQLEAATAATNRAIGEVRAISHALRPAALEQVGLTKAIEWMVEQLGEGSATKFSAELDTIDGLLAPELEMNLFRIIQEGLNNTRHASARQVILEVKREAAGLRVSLFDDGRGFDAEPRRGESKPRRGLGLLSMEERATYLGGSLDLQSAPGRGTRVTVRIPLPQTKG